MVARKITSHLLAPLALVALTVCLSLLPPPARASSDTPDAVNDANAAGDTWRVSVASDGTQANGNSYGMSVSAISLVSADGRFVAFESDATNLVAGDTNGKRDIFVHDRQTGATTRVSVASNGAQADGTSYDPYISANGRYVAFHSDATNLVAGDTNGVSDAFVHDRQTGTTERVSVATGGAEGNGLSIEPSLSADGRYVAFMSAATNLVAGDTNGKRDIFVRDRQTGTTTRVSVSTGGAQANGTPLRPAISADGRYVAFDSDAANLVAGDSNGAYDIFVHDRQTGTTERVSVATGGAQANGGSTQPSISADGRYVVFYTSADNMVPGDSNGQWDVILRDRQTSTTELISVGLNGQPGNGLSSAPSISADGRYVAFFSSASDLVAGDTNNTQDIFVRDRQAGTTERVSVAGDGAQANGWSSYPSISADGRFVVFGSDATNLVAGDSNGKRDIFVHERGQKVIHIVGVLFLPHVTK